MALSRLLFQSILLLTRFRLLLLPPLACCTVSHKLRRRRCPSRPADSVTPLLRPRRLSSSRLLTNSTLLSLALLRHAKQTHSPTHCQSDATGASSAIDTASTIEQSQLPGDGLRSPAFVSSRHPAGRQLTSLHAQSSIEQDDSTIESNL